MTTLHDKQFRDVLDRLHAAALGDDDLVIDELPADATARQRADAMAQAYLPISAEGGRLLYSLVRAARPQTVVEFGTSYGISTLYLAAAVKDNGVGQVISTELSAVKVAAARNNLAEAGVEATVLEGDALDTLAAVDGPIGVVLLDGWKGLYLPVLRRLEERLAPGALVIGDDSSFDSVRPYVEHVRDPANGYVSVGYPIEDGMEISCRVG
jgi:predicted O-methyltransferase YrrM